ncbi:LysM peptidoglycan-binding domain-containing protein [Actinomyces trachealis]|uniref:LysM peptidoglycan-binding domain-containing protein n=1 Tax=Actinomyces trachealis TaxID=2763540 RepID=UPI001892B7ED|nr:LysM domain-containing protein [Actinomyces trachealis]
MQTGTALKLLSCASAATAALLGRLSYLRQQSLRGLSVASWGSTQFSDAVLVGLCLLGAMAAAWYCLSALLALVATASPRPHHLPQASGAREFCERLLEAWGAPLVRRLAAGALVASLGTAPALAAEAPVADDFGWQPTQSASQTTPPTQQENTPAPTATTQPVKTNQHTVQPGESLWEITATQLGLPNNSAAVATAWPQLYEVNKDAIGPDPGLIWPGTTLRLPWASN